jgi:hypothetical protein
MTTMLLFLDFDGVLHPAISTDAIDLFCRRPLLEDVLRSCPQVDVVISSTWRETRTLDQLQSLFSADIQPRIIAVTPRWRDVQNHADMGTYVRQAEIEGCEMPAVDGKAGLRLTINLTCSVLFCPTWYAVIRFMD